MEGDEQLIRRLVWQNGFYRGVLAVANKALSGEIGCEECKRLAAEVDRVMNLPLPSFLDNPRPTEGENDGR